MSGIPLAAQLRCVQREVRLRKQFYPRWVDARKMTPQEAQYETAAMEAVAATLRGLVGGGQRSLFEETTA
ncbi:MAG: hypothetical protein H0T51_07860 [Pirellulales bacterium]|nr:hypothetical protein [Pirellulales bacterium]